MQPLEFSDKQKIAIAKAVIYIISSDGIITDKEKVFFTQLCTELKADNEIMQKAIGLSDKVMFETLQTVTDNQEAYIMACLNDAAYADNELAEEESKLIEIFASNIHNDDKTKDFYMKILTF